MPDASYRSEILEQNLVTSTWGGRTSVLRSPQTSSCRKARPTEIRSVKTQRNVIFGSQSKFLVVRRCGVVLGKAARGNGQQGTRAGCYEQGRSLFQMEYLGAHEVVSMVS